MRKRLWSGGSACLIVGLSATRALAHAGFSLEEERLNIGLVALSFALIAAFVYLAAQGRGDRGSDV